MKRGVVSTDTPACCAEEQSAKVRRVHQTFNDVCGDEAHGGCQQDAPESVLAAASEAKAAFNKVSKNKNACLNLLCQNAQRIERIWYEDEALRRALLEAFASCLVALSSHKEKVLQELSSLGPKISPTTISLKHFLVLVLPIERQHTRGLRDDEFMVLRPDDLSKADVSLTTSSRAGFTPAGNENIRMPLTVVMDNLRSAFNVGSIFRTAECLRIKQLHLCGYTATPSDNKGQTGRAAMGADTLVPWNHREKAHDVVRELCEQGVPVYALETVADAESVHSFDFPSPCALLIGNERHGLEGDLLALCTAPLRIGCYGVKNSLNVAVAFAVCAYEVSRQWHLSETKDVAASLCCKQPKEEANDEKISDQGVVLQ